jgi:hypothetical protein
MLKSITKLEVGFIQYNCSESSLNDIIQRFSTEEYYNLLSGCDFIYNEKAEHIIKHHILSL